ncbi:putative calcium/calmodulin dependent protein kinase [Aspergillus keveii]|uniref:Calcium/calmodulin dependent protein kinase n=1 Tax=Aspergillus keveii TaxID=714993 RepID=A0ABR4GC28_9EURO
MIKRSILQLASTPKKYIGASGASYWFKELLQERPHLGRVWLATSGQNKFILKNIPKNIFDNFNSNIWPQLPKSPNIRLPWDTVPGERILVYKYLSHDFFSLVKEDISLKARKQILKASLLGIADLHDRHIVHLDVKPDNILVDGHHDAPKFVVENVQLIDLENAAHLPDGRCIKGMLAGNANWRSPEAHLKGELNKPADIFSFGIVSIYAILGKIILGPDKDFQKHEAQGVLPALIRLQRQVSYFGDTDGIRGLLNHLADDKERAAENIGYKPFSAWPNMPDSEFKDLIRGLTNLDPARRLSARQALEHPWFG